MDGLEASRLSEMKGSVREVEGLWRHPSLAWYTPPLPPLKGVQASMILGYEAQTMIGLYEEVV